MVSSIIRGEVDINSLSIKDDETFDNPLFNEDDDEGNYLLIIIHHSIRIDTIEKNVLAPYNTVHHLVYIIKNVNFKITFGVNTHNSNHFKIPLVQWLGRNYDISILFWKSYLVTILLNSTTWTYGEIGDEGGGDENHPSLK